jgi:preprotein translocase subunit SecG
MAMTSNAERWTRRLLLVVVLLTANALAVPCMLCSGEGGGGGARGSVPQAEATGPCAQVVRIPCRGQPYLIP